MDRRMYQKYEEQMKRQHAEAYARRGDQGKFASIFLPDAKSKHPFWVAKDGPHLVDILMYIAGKNSVRPQPGQPTYFCDIFIHRGVGVSEDSFVCLNRNYKKPCPICQYQAKLLASENQDKKLIKSLNPTRRAIYNVIVRDTPEEMAKGVQVWDVSHFKFETQLSELSKMPGMLQEEGAFEYFWKPDGGKSVYFTVTGAGSISIAFGGLRFLERKYPITDAHLDSVITIDEIIKIPNYDEVYEAFHQSITEGPTPEAEAKTDPAAEDARKTYSMPSASVESDVPDNVVSKKEEEPVEAEYEECPYGGNFGKDYDTYNECDNCEARVKCNAAKNPPAATKPTLTPKGVKPAEPTEARRRRPGQ